MSDCYVICIPIYNDWDSAKEVVARLHEQARNNQRVFRFVLVDDGSTETLPLKDWTECKLSNITILRLRRNLGHQRSIAIGLAYIYRSIACRGVVVMDGDGEDDPNDVEQLLKTMEQGGNQRTVFAKRMKRTESMVFRLFYFLFRLIHYGLIGRKVEVGNFSCLPKIQLTRLVVVSELWNHYAAAVVKAKLPRILLPIARGRRIHGQSKMNFVSLVMHGLSAISVFSDEIIVRMLVALSSLFSLLAVIFLGLLVSQPFAGSALWIRNEMFTILLLLLFSLLSTFAFALIILQSRNLSSFVPLRDYEVFILETEEIGNAA